MGKIIKVTKKLFSTVYQRAIPKNLIPLNSQKGKQLLAGASIEKNLESFIPLMSNFSCQDDIDSCGYASLTMALNTLYIDPGFQWKGIWRYYSEKNLKGRTQLGGITLEEFSELAKKNFLSEQVFYHINQKKENNIKTASYQTFRDCALSVSKRQGLYIFINFSRPYLQQTGEGHYSPIAAVNHKEEMALILDVARFKYPPFWVSLNQLYHSFQDLGKPCQKTRGFILLSRSITKYANICRYTYDHEGQNSYLKQLCYLKIDEYKISNNFPILFLLNYLNENFRQSFIPYIFDKLQLLKENIVNVYQDNEIKSKLKEELKNLQLIQDDQLIETKQLINLINDFDEKNILDYLVIIILAIPDQVYQYLGDHNRYYSEIIQEKERIILNDRDLHSELKNLRNYIGISKDFCYCKDKSENFSLHFNQSNQVKQKIIETNVQNYKTEKVNKIFFTFYSSSFYYSPIQILNRSIVSFPICKTQIIFPQALQNNKLLCLYLYWLFNNIPIHIFWAGREGC